MDAKKEDLNKEIVDDLVRKTIVNNDLLKQKEDELARMTQELYRYQETFNHQQRVFYSISMCRKLIVISKL